MPLAWYQVPRAACLQRFIVPHCSLGPAPSFENSDFIKFSLLLSAPCIFCRDSPETEVPRLAQVLPASQGWSWLLNTGLRTPCLTTHLTCYLDWPCSAAPMLLYQAEHRYSSSLVCIPGVHPCLPWVTFRGLMTLGFSQANVAECMRTSGSRPLISCPGWPHLSRALIADRSPKFRLLTWVLQ